MALKSAYRNYLIWMDGSFRHYCQLKIRKAIEQTLAEIVSHQVVEWENETHLSADSSGHDNSSKRCGCRGHGERRVSDEPSAG